MSNYAPTQQSNAAGYIPMGQQLGAPNQVINPSVFNAFEGLQDEAQHLLVRASNLADRLCGSLPPSPANQTGAASSPSGLFEETSVHVATTRAFLAVALAAIERIEQKLP